MKKLLSFILVIAVTAIGFTSCKNDKKTKKAAEVRCDYLAAMPQDVVAAAKINFGTLYDLSKLDSNPDFKNVLAALGGDAAKFFSNADATGIDVSKPLVVGYAGGKRAVAIASVKDENTLKATLTAVTVFADSDDFKRVEEDGITYISVEGNLVAAFNSSSFVVSIEEDYSNETKTYLTSLLTQKRFVADAPGFAEFVDMAAPIAVWGEMQGLMEFLKDENVLRAMDIPRSARKQILDQMNAQVNSDALEGSFCIFSVAFNKNTLDLEIVTKVKPEYMQQATECVAPFDEKILAYLPKNACFAATANMCNYKKMLEMAAAQGGKDVKDAVEQLDALLSMVSLSVDDFPNHFAVAVDKYDSFAVGAYYDYYSERWDGRYMDPSIVVVFDANETIYNLMEQYMNDGSISLAYSDGFVSISTGFLPGKKSSGVFENNLKGTEAAKVLKSSPMLAAVVDCSNIALNSIIKCETDEQVAKAVKPLVDACEFVTLTVNMTEDRSVMKLSLDMDTKGSANVLSFVADMAMNILSDNLF